MKELAEKLNLANNNEVYNLSIDFKKQIESLQAQLLLAQSSTNDNEYQMRHKHQQELVEIKVTHEREVNETHDDYKIQMEKMARDHSIALSKAMGSNQNEMRSSSEANKISLWNLKNEHEKRLRQQQEGHAKALFEKEKRILEFQETITTLETQASGSMDIHSKKLAEMKREMIENNLRQIMLIEQGFQRDQNEKIAQLKLEHQKEMIEFEKHFIERETGLKHKVVFDG